jgi:hypothetical protein
MILRAITHSSRFVSGRTDTVHFLFPQREHRMRLTTVSSSASQPASAARVLGCALRVWPQAHLSVNTYCPKLSDSLMIVSEVRGGIMAGHTYSPVLSSANTVLPAAFISASGSFSCVNSAMAGERPVAQVIAMPAALQHFAQCFRSRPDAVIQFAGCAHEDCHT